MKKFTLPIFYFLFYTFAQAQPYGNEWINFNQEYYKIKIGKEGIYKIDYKALNAIGFPLTTINPKNIQLWINGAEQPIIINGQEDNKFDNNDYIEFYGTFNDGKLDAPLYPNASEQPHQFMSLYSDTATYFLTVSITSEGKRVVIHNDTNYTGKTADPYFMFEQVKWWGGNNGGTFWDGLGFASEGFYSEYTEGEGWSNTNYSGGITTTFLTPFYSPVGPKPFVEVLAHTRGNNKNSYDADGFNNGLQLSIQPSGTLIDQKRVTGLAKYFFQDSINDKSLIGKTTTSFKTYSFLLAQSAHSISYFKLTYPRLLDLGDSSNLKFKYNSSNSFLKYQKYHPSRSRPMAYDINNHTLSLGKIIGGVLYCNLSSIGSNKWIYLQDESSIITLTEIQLKSFKFNALLTKSTCDYLIISNQKLDSGANAYQNFLSTSLGGNHTPYLAFVNDIYDQFYYGLKHPQGIKNFCRYSINTSSNLKYLLLLGKGQRYNNSRFNELVNTNLDLIPTYGVPPSDYYFVSGYNGSTLNPLLTVGRIPAMNNVQVANYINKLYNQKLLGYQPWKKKVLLLAGGSTSSEVSQFTSYLNSYHNLLSKTEWGASKKLITKQDPTAVDSSLKSKIQTEINSGHALIDYFGHGSTQASDIDFGDAYQLQNTNKYPFFYFNGCGLGNTFDGTSIAEEYLLTKDKGAIGWLAGTTFGFINELHNFALIFHQNLTENCNLSFASNISKTIKTFQNIASPYNKALCHQMLFMGDPSIVIFDAEKPDYTIDLTRSSIYPEKVTAETDSFALNLSIQNLALFNKDSFAIKVVHTLPSGSKIYYKQKFISGIGNQETIKFWVQKKKDLNIKGSNSFFISLDSANTISEQIPYGELNNTATLSYYFSSSSAQILYPKKDGIVNSTGVELAAQSLRYNKTDFKFVFELDTTPEFNSSYKKSSGTILSSYIAKTNFSLLPIDSLDYYWRVKIDDGSGLGIWDVSTFSMIYGSSPGWSQGYIDKFMETKKTNLGYDSLKNLKFSTMQSIPYEIETGGKSATYRFGRTIWHNGFPLNWGYYHNNGIVVVAYNLINEDRFCFPTKHNVTSSNPWWTNPIGHQTKYFYPPGIAKTCHYTYNTFNKTDRDSFLHLIKNIPPEYNLVIMNGHETNVKNWEQELFDELEKFGASKIKTLKDGDPYVFIGQRGLPIGEAFEKMADPNNVIPTQQQLFILPTNFDILSNSGHLTSSIIGPAKEWKYFYRTISKKDSPKDRVSFSIYGIDTNGIHSLLYSNLLQRELKIDGINAKRYPYIKVEASIEDSTNKTPTSVDRWTVLFDGYPEGLINPPALVFQNKDTLEEGDTLIVKIAYSNISSLDMDSVLVLTTLSDDQNQKDTFEFKKYKILKSKDSLFILRKIYTKGLTGNNRVDIMVNPEMEQPEEYLFNNTWQFSFFIKPDQRNPYLDVVFDGRHITNLEIVSPNPTITITAVDENKYFYIDDSKYFKVQLKEPGRQFRYLKVDSDTFTFVPSKGPGDKSLLVFNPLNLKDGIYELSISVMDVKGNFASSEDYKISFKIITKSTLTNIYPYPNPFTTKTRFVFTLTGEKVPDYFKISIVSISGTLVKEITLDELGAIDIGNNITKYEWDGTDTYGDKLANGVYLYKVTAKLDGKDLELSETIGDVNFKKGFGKLYIMR